MTANNNRPRVRLEYAIPVEVTLNAHITVADGVGEDEVIEEIMASLQQQRQSLGRAAVTLSLRIQPARIAQAVARQVRARMANQFCAITVC